MAATVNNRELRSSWPGSASMVALSLRPRRDEAKVGAAGPRKNAAPEVNRMGAAGKKRAGRPAGETPRRAGVEARCTLFLVALSA